MLYRMVTPEAEKPSMATKCITQIPVPPRAMAPNTSHAARVPPEAARARDVHASPVAAPVHEIA
ncbi:hypothetical protein GCM10017772_35030 [Promicromonospora soli]|uniref:Uncharacterized protein n=1 Tax=Promicromonospora soli TaxID=2035533 RepID=A0A919G1E6_9MICO|nr:hypothetical protein GCM10017772_35030 [Promicromonospora soli]